MSEKTVLEWQKQEKIDQPFCSAPVCHNTKKKVVGLADEKFLVKCMANKNPPVMLLDTGAQVSSASKSSLTKNYHELTVKPLKEISC